MILAINQPDFFPYLGYFQLINLAEKFVVYDDVNYIKGGWINRNRILVNGNPSWFTLELFGASPNKKINELTVGNNGNKLLKTIKQYYSKAPYYKESIDCIQSILLNNEKNLAKYLFFELKTVSQYLGITTEFCYSSDINKDNSLKGECKVRHICHLLNAKEYINPIGGTKLYSFEEFQKDGIDLSFIKMDSDIIYKQFNYDFVPSLSIIDVMMFNSVERIQNFLNRYQRIREKCYLENQLRISSNRT